MSDHVIACSLVNLSGCAACSGSFFGMTGPTGVFTTIGTIAISDKASTVGRIMTAEVVFSRHFHG